MNLNVNWRNPSLEKILQFSALWWLISFYCLYFYSFVNCAVSRNFVCLVFVWRKWQCEETCAFAKYSVFLRKNEIPFRLYFAEFSQKEIPMETLVLYKKWLQNWQNPNIQKEITPTNIKMTPAVWDGYAGAYYTHLAGLLWRRHVALASVHYPRSMLQTFLYSPPLRPFPLYTNVLPHSLSSTRL